MTSQAFFALEANDRRVTVNSAVAALAVQKLADGRAAVLNNTTTGVLSGSQGRYRDDGQWTVPKTTGLVILDGGEVWWDFTNQLAHYKRQNSGDFLLGTAVGDAHSSDTTMGVNLNKPPIYVADLARDPWSTTVIGTQAAGGLAPPYRRGGAHGLVITATNEAQKVDALSDDGIVIPACGPVVELGIKVVTAGAAANCTSYFGLSNASHATDPTTNTQLLALVLKSNLNKIQFQSKDGTNTTALTDSTQTFTAGTRFHVWLDARNPAAVAIYVNGVQVLASTTFNISAAGAAVWKSLAWAAKTAATDTFEVQVDWHRVRFMDQP